VGVFAKQPSVMHVLQSALEPPNSQAVQKAVSVLRMVGAMRPAPTPSHATSSVVVDALSPLGFHLGKLPVSDVRLGKFVLYGCMLGCVMPCVQLAALMGNRSIFVSPHGEREQANKAHATFRVGKSDHLSMLNAYKQWLALRRGGQGGMRKASEFAGRSYLNNTIMNTIPGQTDQYVSALVSAGFLPRMGRNQPLPTVFTKNERSKAAILACLCAGLYPNVVRAVEPTQYDHTAHGSVARDAVSKAKEIRYLINLRAAVPERQQGEGEASSAADGKIQRTNTNQTPGPREAQQQQQQQQSGKLGVQRVFLHPRSINFHCTHYEQPFLVYLQVQQTKMLYVHDCSAVGAYPLLMFGGRLSEEQDRAVVAVDGWLKMKVSTPKVYALVKQLRKELDRLLEHKITYPELKIDCEHPLLEAILSLCRKAE
jgi:hypothetical protein